MANNSLKFTTHEGVEKTVPVDTIRMIRPMTDEDKAKAKESLKENKGIEIDPKRINVRIEFADKSSKLARETVDALRDQGVGLVNMGGDRFVPAANITAAEAFTKDDAERLKGEDYTLGQTFRAKVETRAGTLLSSATPEQVMDRRAKALDLDQSTPVKSAPAKGGPKAKMG